MRKYIFLLLMLLPLPLLAQNVAGANALLDRAVARIKADAAVQMDYSYSVYDDEGNLSYRDKGIMKLDDGRYALLMDNMKVWCNGKVQWSYMKDVDEIYITDADSEEAENLSPLYIMEKYRTGYTVSLKERDSLAMVTFLSKDSGEEVDKLELFIDEKTERLAKMFIYMQEQGRVEVFLDNYKAKCSFAKKSYECPVKEFPTAEVIDMR